MVSSSNTAMINTLAGQVMLSLPKLYGPGGLNTSGLSLFFTPSTNPSTDLVASLEQLETAAVDPSLLTGSQTVASVENQTIGDLNTLAASIQAELDLSGQPVGESGIQSLFFRLQPNFKAAATSVVTDSMSFTAGAANPPFTIVNPPPPPSSGVEQYLVSNLSTGITDWENGQIYSGPVANLQNEFIMTTTDNLNITATKPNNFIHTGSGNDAISVLPLSVGESMNVLDGGGGSNFLVASTGGLATFYLDDRGPATDIWSTISNFHFGDNATIWGVTPSDFNLAWMDDQGASGYTGLTLHASATGKPTASLTLVGYTSADLSNGKLTVTYGTTPTTGGVAGSSYMNIHGDLVTNSVNPT